MFWNQFLNALRVRLSGSLRPAQAKRQARLNTVGGIEGLELRTLLSVNAVFDKSGHLRLNGKDPFSHGHKHGSRDSVTPDQIQSIVVDGGSGNNKIDLSAVSARKFSSVQHVTINGGAGHDSITGSQLDDTINGDAGDDDINGADGDDSLNGGTGDDVLAGGTGTDDIHGDDGNDSLHGDVNETEDSGSEHHSSTHSESRSRK
jgi:Ca2+-binding RTX toxin-like protein